MALTDKLTAIGNAIRAKTGKSGTLTLPQMVTEIGSISDSEDISWHQCPEAVRNYLAYVAEHPYSPSDYTYSYILDYAPSTAVLANTKPVGKTIDGVTFCDNEPNIARPFSTANKSGTLTALDFLRWINTTYQSGSEAGAAYPRGVNTRDIGGWSCGSGRDNRPCTVKYGMIIRGGEPNVADRELMVEKLGIKSELQLLPTNEQSSDRYMKSVWGIDWYGNDTTSSVYGIEGNAVNKYLWKKFLGAVFDSTAKGKPIYIHCGIGADRTGAVMVMVEALLGMTENEIAQDYELTNFAFYQDSTQPRRRNTNSYQAYMTAIKSVPLVGGLSDTFEHRAISFALSLGFTAAQINAYRNACTNGNPVQINPTMTSYTVTKSGSNITFDNSASSVSEYQHYEVEVTPDSDYAIDSISVTMGGVDITDSVVSGTETNLYNFVSNNLTGCSSANKKSRAIKGQSYVEDIECDSGYLIDDISDITVTMGGVDITSQAIILFE